ncbi:hypothetical protein [Amycolatopsis sp.]|uniref:hypothetical protein n=1 Tax=Amycolatopsis sp. TaxID=37632 RepID=UPI002CEE3621|nr:hypothetical protein [Amycolatopsis sp.]HVV12650.1 hypothetical protein [Amycolatopsis sp.]
MPRSAAGAAVREDPVAPGTGAAPETVLPAGKLATRVAQSIEDDIIRRGWPSARRSVRNRSSARSTASAARCCERLSG